MTRRRKGRDINGILLLDKPTDITSNRALQQVKRALDARKAGHTGSLDPLATGLLPVCFGEATKVSAYLLEAEKSYEADICLGITTNTGDSDGEIVATHSTEHVTSAAVAQVLPSFRGEIDQVPPMYSALKKDGKRLYKLAREGVEVERPARRVTIFKLTMLSLEDQLLRIAVHCSKGTYIRTLAEDIGVALQCGAHISALRRTSLGPFAIHQALALDTILQDPLTAEGSLLSVDRALIHLPAIHVATKAATAIKHGNAVEAVGDKALGLVRMYDSSEQFLGIGEIGNDRQLCPRRIMCGKT